MSARRWVWGSAIALRWISQLGNTAAGENFSASLRLHPQLYRMLLFFLGGDIFIQKKIMSQRSNPLFRQVITSFSRATWPRGQNKYCYNKQIVFSHTKQEQSGCYLAASCQNHQWQKQYLLTWLIRLFATQKVNKGGKIWQENRDIGKRHQLMLCTYKVFLMLKCIFTPQQHQLLP